MRLQADNQSDLRRFCVRCPSRRACPWREWGDGCKEEAKRWQDNKNKEGGKEERKQEGNDTAKDPEESQKGKAEAVPAPVCKTWERRGQLYTLSTIGEHMAQPKVTLDNTDRMTGMARLQHLQQLQPALAAHSGLAPAPQPGYCPMR